MVETPYGPERRDRDDDPRAGSPSRAGFAGDEPAEALSEDDWSAGGGDWELPEWVDGLEEIDLDEEGPESSPAASLLRPEGAEAAEAADLAELEGPGASAEGAPRGETLEEALERLTGSAPSRTSQRPVPAPEVADPDEDWGIDGELGTGASWLMDLDENQLAGQDGEEGEEASEHQLIALPQRAARGSRRGWLVASVLLIAAAYGGIELWDTYGPREDAAPVAVRRPTPRPAPAGEATVELPPPPAEPAETGEAELAGLETAEPGSAPDLAGASGAARPFAGREPLLALTDLGFALRSTAEPPFLVSHHAADEALLGPAELAATDPASAPESDSSREVRETTVSATDLVVLPELNSPIRAATAEDLAMMWLGSTVPMEAIDRPAKLLTPNVGSVRVILYGGELFDGRLYAVGEKKVWLELERTERMALLSHMVERIEHIESGRNSPGLGDKGSQGYAGLDQVRVRTPGGVFYGNLLNRDGDVVTLLTADGARITLHDARVEPAGLSRSRIVDASGDVGELLGTAGPEEAERSR